MVAHVIDEFRVLKDYIVMVLDQEVEKNTAGYRIDGQLYTPVCLGATTVPIPGNYIAVKTRQSFKGAVVEVI